MGRYLAIDVGTRTLGLAVSDEAASIALPLAVIHRTKLERDLAALGDWIDGRDVTDVVVGLPLNMDGSAGAMTAECEAVARAVVERFGLRLHRWDERLSTVAAERALLEGDVSRRRRKAVIDKIAATIFLQAFLDRRALGGGAP